MTIGELLKAFATCVVIGHDWQGGEVCQRCTAKKDGPTLFDVIKQVLAESSECYCRPCWEKIGRPSADFYAPEPAEKVLECFECDKEFSVRDLIWVRVTR